MAARRLHFSRDEFQVRLARTRAAMQAKGIETLIVSDPSNMAWLTGYDGWSFYVHQAVVVGESGEPLWFGRLMDAQGALRNTWLAKDNIIAYPDIYVQSTERHPMQPLAAELEKRNWATKPIGVEMDNYWYSAKAHEVLCLGLPNAKISDATALVNWCRAVKSDTEISYMRIAARIVERMHQRIYEVAEPGLRKCDLVAEI